ncbi:recombinase family protein [uncultured Rubinisphaera sp.]|uniref:recombinase family protein n=1 Tax=uncultured Rubinisphaera sp. TaxID=1678686 RepID=UPI0030DB873D
MTTQIPEAGAVNEELASEVHVWWIEATQNTCIDLKNFDPSAPLNDRIAWALQSHLEIGTVYTRYSTKFQDSTADQTKTIVEHAATKQIYCPPEFVCIDEGQRGCKARRDGLERMLFILKQRMASVLLVFKASRLYRQAYRGYQLIQQEVVEEGLRAISVTQQIDTNDSKQWKMLFQIHGIADEMLIEATSDHVRAGLKGMFSRGYTVGALSVGYRRKEVPGAPLTNRGLPRTEPEVDQYVGSKIVEHYMMIRDGVPIRQGWLKWVDEGLPNDPRSTSIHMTYIAYRNMLQREAYIGNWEFGRNRNQFSTKKDYTQQIEQPDDEVVKVHIESLRIMEDELFNAVQKVLAGHKKGPRGPRVIKDSHLWDRVTDIFYCAVCGDRFYQAGANGKGMRCKNGDLCPCISTVRREVAVQAICLKLQSLIQQDAVLIEQVIVEAQRLDSQGDQDLQRDIEQEQQKLSSVERKLNDYLDLAGQGSDADREEMKARVRSVRVDRNSIRYEINRLKNARERATGIISDVEVRATLNDFAGLLKDGSAGELGDDTIHKAVEVFRLLVGGKIYVHVEQRVGRKNSNVRGMFRPHLISTVMQHLDQSDLKDVDESDEISVWLREPPRMDLIAERVHELIDIERLSHRETAKKLQEEGFKVNSGNVWYSYRRWYEMQGEEPPNLPYNNGHKRISD